MPHELNTAGIPGRVHQETLSGPAPYETRMSGVTGQWLVLEQVELNDEPYLGPGFISVREQLNAEYDRTLRIGERYFVGDMDGAVIGLEGDDIGSNDDLIVTLVEYKKKEHLPFLQGRSVNRPAEFALASIVAEDVVANGPVDVTGDSIRVDRAQAVTISVHEKSGGTVDVTLQWEDAAGNVFQTQTPSDLQAATEAWHRAVRKGRFLRVTVANNAGATSTNVSVVAHG